MVHCNLTDKKLNDEVSTTITFNFNHIGPEALVGWLHCCALPYQICHQRLLAILVNSVKNKFRRIRDARRLERDHVRNGGLSTYRGIPLQNALFINDVIVAHGQPGSYSLCWLWLPLSTGWRGWTEALCRLYKVKFRFKRRNWLVLCAAYDMSPMSCHSNEQLERVFTCYKSSLYHWDPFFLKTRVKQQSEDNTVSIRTRLSGRRSRYSLRWRRARRWSVPRELVSVWQATRDGIGATSEQY